VKLHNAPAHPERKGKRSSPPIPCIRRLALAFEDRNGNPTKAINALLKALPEAQ